MNIALWITAGLLAAASLASGAVKLTEPMEKLIASGYGWVEDFRSSTVRAIGTLEVMAAVGLTLPAVLGVAPVRIRIVAVWLATATAIAAAVGGCSAAGSAAGPPEGPATTGPVEVIELQVQNDQYAAPDLDPAGPSPGDMYVYSGTAMKDGRPAGRGGGTCQITHVDGGKATSQCLITMELEHGSLTAQSLWVSDTSPLDMAITGGTGAYRDARGTIRFWDIATPNERLRAEIMH